VEIFEKGLPQPRITVSSPGNDLSLEDCAFLHLPHDVKVIGFSEYQQGIASTKDTQSSSKRMLPQAFIANNTAYKNSAR